MIILIAGQIITTYFHRNLPHSIVCLNRRMRDKSCCNKKSSTNRIVLSSLAWHNAIGQCALDLSVRTNCDALLTHSKGPLS